MAAAGRGEPVQARLRAAQAEPAVRAGQSRPAQLPVHPFQAGRNGLEERSDQFQSAILPYRLPVQGPGRDQSDRRRRRAHGAVLDRSVRFRRAADPAAAGFAIRFFGHPCAGAAQPAERQERLPHNAGRELFPRDFHRAGAGHLGARHRRQYGAAFR